MRDKLYVKILKIEDIEKIYTEKLNYFLSLGYTIYSKGMEGTQGDKAKITFKDNFNNVYSLRLYTLYRNGINIAGICIEQYKNLANNISEIWNDKGEKIFDLKFYKIENNSYVEKIEEFEKIRELHLYRLSSRRKDNLININYNKDVILKILHNHKGYKRCKKEDILEVEKFIGCFNRKYYSIKVNNKKDIFIYY